MKTFLIVAWMAASSLAAQEMTPNPDRPHERTFPETVSVSGTGHAHVVPDRYSFTVGVQTIAPTVDAAMQENNDRMAAVTHALKAAGATAAEIQTASFTITPQQDYQQGKLPRILGYEVTNSMTVTRTSVGDAGRLLQAAVTAGVNTSSGLQFGVSDPARGRDAALRAAMDDARAKAATLASEAGRQLGRALSITEGGSPAPVPYPRAMAMKAMVAEVPVEAGTDDLTYSVAVVFELR